jgi:hypothetical protein
MAPRVAQEGEFTFIIHTRELPYEPPHVHVWCSEGEFRVNLLTDELMDELPAGKRHKLREAYRQHAATIRQAWREYHGQEEG